MSRALTVQDNSKNQLEKVQKESINSPINSQIPQDFLTSLLADKRSYGTKQSYERWLNYFFNFAYGKKPSEQIISQFLGLGKFEAIQIVLQYKSNMIARGLAEATVNCRLSALRSLVSFAVKIGKCNWTLDDVKSEPVQSYRDTTGVSPQTISDMLAQCDRLTVQGKRNYAILRLLWSNALRRNELVSLNVGDFNHHARTLQILGKGHGSQKSKITIDKETADSIRDWVSCNDIRDPNRSSRDQALFCALDMCHLGHRLTGTAIYHIVSLAARRLGVQKAMSPHRIRHSAITAALDATNGDVRKVQKMSRHKKLDTLMIYDDNRTNMQGQVSDLLGSMLG